MPDRALGSNKDDLTAMHILSYGGTSVPSAIGVKFGQIAKSHGIAVGDAPILASRLQSAAGAIGHPVPKNTVHRTLVLARAATDFHFSFNLGNRREALSNLHRAILLVQGRIETAGDYHRHVLSEGLQDGRWRPEIIDAAAVLKFSPGMSADAWLEKLDAQRQAGAQRRAFARLDEAVAVESELAMLARPAVEGVDAKTVARLAELETERARCLAVVEAGAVHLDFTALPGAEGRIVIDGKPISGRADISRPTDVVIAEVGTLRVTPPASSAVSAEVAFASADQSFIAELRKLGVASVAEARLKLEQQRADAASVAQLRQRLIDICVADETLGIAPGIDALRAALLGVTRTEQGSADSDVATSGDIEARLNDCRAAEVKAAAVHKVAAAAVQQAEVRQATLASQEAADTLRLTRAQSTLAALNEAGPAEQAADKLQGAIELEARLADQLETATQNAAAFDVETLQRRLAAADQRVRNETAERIRLSNLVGGLEATVKAEGGKGPAGLLEEAKDEEAAATTSHARLCREADTLSMLSRVLRDTASAAARQFVEPVTKRAAFYIQRLLPGSSVGLSQEMAVDGLVRQGRAEVGHALSRGTQEQLAILTRLAFADLLLDKQRPVSIVLDDALVYSDDNRLEVMTDILADAAKRMQIILLTCRAKAFRHVEATRLSLT